MEPSLYAGIATFSDGFRGMVIKKCLDLREDYQTKGIVLNKLMGNRKFIIVNGVVNQA